MAKEKSFYELSKTQTLDNTQLAEWMRALEDKVAQSTVSIAKKSTASAAKQSEEKSA